MSPAGRRRDCLHQLLALSFRASDRRHWRGNPFSFSCLRRPLFFQQRKKRGKETPPKTTFLDFLTRLRPQLISLVLPRERCAVEISPKCCIVSASLFAAAFALKCRAVQAWQEHFLNSGPWPPPTFAALRQRRDLIIAQTPGVRFPKGRGRNPSLLVVSRKGDFQGGREIEIPSPLNGVLWILSFAKERK